MKKICVPFLLFTASLILSLLAAELLSGIYLRQFSPLFAARQALYQKAAASLNLFNEDFEKKMQGSHGKEAQKMMLPHPYFGYSPVYDLANEKKSATPYDYFLLTERYNYMDRPHSSADQFRIGIFGGSVASSLFAYWTKHKDFEQGLKKIFRDIGEKQILLYNFSMPGGKQPQQFGSFQYFMNVLDLTINLDGFNEMDIRQEPSYPFFYPYHAPALFPKQQNYRKIISEIYVYTKVKRYLSQLPLRFRPLTHSALYYLGWKTLVPRLEMHLADETQKIGHSFDNKDILLDQNLLVKYEDQISLMSNLWKRFIFLQFLLAQDKSIRSFFFLQPNQYLINSKPFSSIEKKMALNRGSHFESKISYAYTLFTSEIVNLKKQGVPIFDLSKIFTQVQQTLYMDDCCHLNEKGNELLSKAILSAIKKNET